ncbi:hypothetical protein [Bacillus piscicola]|uniref:hypothetical protein n=1 Tax=Bacillus piscicola TaxID=1632684 RepID=UPI001F0939A6|nr:hypothetical protein [Bacillus piscicola]
MIALLVILAYIADIFKKDIGVSPSSTNVINMQVIGTSLFLIVTIGLFSLLMYFQVKKSNTFLKHRLWEKMYVILPVIFLISLIVVFILFLTEPLSDLTQISRWIIYVLIYYLLFLMNVTVLAIIHKVKKKTMPNENKIGYSFVWTSLGLLIVIFIL